MRGGLTLKLREEVLPGWPYAPYSPEAGAELIGIPPAFTPQPLLSAQPVSHNAIMAKLSASARRPGEPFLRLTKDFPFITLPQSL